MKKIFINGVVNFALILALFLAVSAQDLQTTRRNLMPVPATDCSEGIEELG